MRVEQLTAPTIDAAADEARRRLSDSTFRRSDVLEDGRIVGCFQRSKTGREIVAVPTVSR